MIAKKIYFSKSTGGFYDSQIHGVNMPVDCVEITEDTHRAMMTAQAQGKRITQDSKGRPVAADRLPLTAEQLTKASQSAALVALETTDLVALRCMKAGVAFPKVWRDYTTALRAIIRSTTPVAALPVAPDYPANT